MEHVKGSAQSRAQDTHGGDHLIISSFSQTGFFTCSLEENLSQDPSDGVPAAGRTSTQRHVLMDKETLKLDLFGSDFPIYPQACKNKCKTFK